MDRTPATQPVRPGGTAASGAETRERLLVAATRAFAEHGVTNASLLDITRQAGQRNRGAVHYHFGSREGLLAAVLEQHAAFLSEREHRLLEVAQGRPDDDLAAALEALVRPATELSETGWSGPGWARRAGFAAGIAGTSDRRWAFHVSVPGHDSRVRCVVARLWIRGRVPRESCA